MPSPPRPRCTSLPPAGIAACDGVIQPRCTRSDEDFVRPGDEDLFTLGSAYWVCEHRDTCDNSGLCSFGITVQPFGAAAPAPGCDFRDIELLDFSREPGRAIGPRAGESGGLPAPGSWR